MTYSPLELDGKVAVVVGGASGIGRAIAHGLAQDRGRHRRGNRVIFGLLLSPKEVQEER